MLVSVTTLDVTQTERVWFAVGGEHVSAVGESPTVSAELQPSRDYSTQGTTASAHMITASILTIPAQPYAVDMEHAPLAIHQEEPVHAMMVILENIASQS